jgi:hypothetical protein
VFGFSHAETTSWSDGYTIGTLVLAAILLVLFVLIEARAEYPLLPPRVILDRTRGGSLLVMLFASVGTFGVFLFLTYYFQATLGFSPVKCGIAFLPLIAALSVVAQISNRVLLPRFGPRPIVPVGMLVSAGAMLGLHQVGLLTSYVSHVLPYLIVLGIGGGLSVAPAFSTGTLGLTPQDAGVGSATLNTGQQVGGSIGTALLNTLAATAATSYLVNLTHTAGNAQAAALRGDTTAFLWSAFAFAAGGIAAGLAMKSGGLAALSEQGDALTLKGGPARAARTEIVQVPVGCRAY